jgi:hypothetical protein
MIFGFPILPIQVEILGITLGLVMFFQVAVGARWIRLPKKYHRKVHRWTGFGLLALGAVHGLFALTMINGWTIG